MCFASQKAPPIPKVAPAPARKDTAGDVEDSARKLRAQQGVYGNIFTSSLGDSSYGKNAVGAPKLAKLGAAA